MRMPKQKTFNPWKGIVSDNDIEKIAKSYKKLIIAGGIICFIGAFITLMGWSSVQQGRNDMMSVYVGLFILFFGFTLFLYPFFHKKALDKEQLRQAQLRALKRGNVVVGIKGKMMNLK